MAGTLKYDGRVSGAAIAAAVNSAADCIVIPYSNGQRVVVIE